MLHDLSSKTSSKAASTVAQRQAGRIEGGSTRTLHTPVNAWPPLRQWPTSRGPAHPDAGSPPAKRKRSRPALATRTSPADSYRPGGDPRSLTDSQSRHEWSYHGGWVAQPYTKTHATLFVDVGFVLFRVLPCLYASSFFSRPSRARCVDSWTVAWQRPRAGSGGNWAPTSDSTTTGGPIKPWATGPRPRCSTR